jgi:branched-chain amino acid transport system permease protein
VIYANVIAIFAASWDLLVGRSGLISMGHALFYGIASYSTALLFRNFGLPIWITIPLATLFGSMISLLVGSICLRVKGPYLALVSMAFPLILQRLFKWAPLIPIVGGELGVRGLPPFFPQLPIRAQVIAEYYLTLILLLISSVIIYKIANSKTGIVFVSILDDEVASKACGINVTRYKLMAFMISGFFASLAGCIQAHLQKFVTPEMFSLTLSFTVIIVTFLGGIGTVYGAIVGAYIYLLLDLYVLEILVPSFLGFFGIAIPSGFGYVKFGIFAFIVLIMVIKWPRGIARFVTDKLEDLEEARDLDERDPKIWKTYKKKESSET